ncbi:MAG: hypothetical protein ACLFQP_00445 [Halothece sp.]
MNNKPQKVTKLFLKSLGLSNYLIKQIVKNANYSVEIGGYRLYSTTDIINSIEVKLENPRTKSNTKQKLKTLLKTLQGESNVVQVDFLQKLSPENRIKVLKDQLTELEKEEKQLTQETSELVQKAKSMVATK